MVRLLLAVFVAAGVAGMHTLGHVAPHGHGVHGHGAHGIHGAHVGVMAGPPPVAAAASVETVLSALRAPDLSPDPMAACVAILTAFAMALLLAAALAAARRPASFSYGPAAAGLPAGRGPPPTPLGLRLADLSVLRT